jgi:hypothetical protein
VRSFDGSAERCELEWLRLRIDDTATALRGRVPTSESVTKLESADTIDTSSKPHIDESGSGHSLVVAIAGGSWKSSRRVGCDPV